MGTPLSVGQVASDAGKAAYAQTRESHQVVPAAKAAQSAGFRIVSYTAQNAVIGTVSRDPARGGHTAMTATVRWDGDWKLVLTPQGSAGLGASGGQLTFWVCSLGRLLTAPEQICIPRKRAETLGDGCDEEPREPVSGATALRLPPTQRDPVRAFAQVRGSPFDSDRPRSTFLLCSTPKRPLVRTQYRPPQISAGQSVARGTLSCVPMTAS